MFVVINHRINNPAVFWKEPDAFMKTIPNNLKPISIFKSKDGSLGTCLWECDSLENLRSFMEKSSSGSSRNDYYEVDALNSMGLPAKKLAA